MKVETEWNPVTEREAETGVVFALTGYSKEVLVTLEQKEIGRRYVESRKVTGGKIDTRNYEMPVAWAYIPEPYSPLCSQPRTVKDVVRESILRKFASSKDNPQREEIKLSPDDAFCITRDLGSYEEIEHQMLENILLAQALAGVEGDSDTVKELAGELMKYIDRRRSATKGEQGRAEDAESNWETT